MKFIHTLAFFKPEQKEYDNLRNGQIIKIALNPYDPTVLLQFPLQEHELREFYETLRGCYEADKNNRVVRKFLQFINPYMEAKRDNYLKSWLEEERAYDAE